MCLSISISWIGTCMNVERSRDQPADPQQAQVPLVHHTSTPRKHWGSNLKVGQQLGLGLEEPGVVAT